MTDIMVTTTAYQVENRSWLLSPHGTEPGTMPSVTLDVAAFPAAAKTDGYIHSGYPIARIDASGLYGPYDGAATDGRQTAAGLLFSSVDVSRGQIRVGSAMVVHGFVDGSKLPVALDAAGQAALPLIHFASVTP